MRYVLISTLMLITLDAMCQNDVHADSIRVDDLRRKILALQSDIDNIQLDLSHTKKRFTRGIIVATIGYTVTITGGLMLGRKNDDLGKALLITGGAVGAVGTVMLIDSFKFIGRSRRSGQLHPR